MKIAKEFTWEMGHRLPEHFGKCKNIHGHSYKMIIEIDGDIDNNGMVLDYYELKQIMNPIIEELDHAFMVYTSDNQVIEFLDKIKSKKVVVGFQSTVENICMYLIKRVSESTLPDNIKKVKIRVCETPDDYAESEMVLNN